MKSTQVRFGQIVRQLTFQHEVRSKIRWQKIGILTLSCIGNQSTARVVDSS